MRDTTRIYYFRIPHKNDVSYKTNNHGCVCTEPHKDGLVKQNRCFTLWAKIVAFVTRVKPNVT